MIWRRCAIVTAIYAEMEDGRCGWRRMRKGEIARGIPQFP